ncbi:MxaK protein [Methylolobus aquaticus]
MKKTLRPLLVLGIVLGVLGAMIEIGALRRVSQQRADLALLASGQDLPVERRPGATPPVQLARAIHLAARERYDDALELYNWLTGRGDPAFTALLQYNLGNLHLRRAVEQVEKMEIFRAVPALELAKDAYRKSLTLAPDFWDAKYNLEVAMRLLPEMARRDHRSDEAEEETETHRSWATLPGFPRGLP